MLGSRRSRRAEKQQEMAVVSSYHFSMQVISRSHGRSAIAAAAYRAGERLVDEIRGRVADYSGRRGVVHSEILCPPGSAIWLKDRQSLWNGVERMERRSDAQLAREINLALPHELSAVARLDLVRRFVREQFVALGMVADIAIHAPVPEKGDDPRNHHAHIMLTLRQASGDGLRAVKTREWNSDSLLRRWREQWARYQNEMLRRHAPVPVREVDHRSLPMQREAARQRGDQVGMMVLDRLPELHVGPRAMNAARRGYVPTSRDRPRHRRPVWRGGGAMSQARHHGVVRYSRIDSGTRLSVNLRRVRGNLGRTDRLLTRYQARGARLKSFAHIQSRNASTTRRNGIGPPVVRKTRLRRLSLVAAFLRELESLIAALLGVRDLQVLRSHRLARSHVLHQAHARVRARGRGRHRVR